MNLHASVSLMIRPFQVDDAPAFVEAVRDSLHPLREWLHWPHASYAEDDARRWFAACDATRQAGTADEKGIFEEGSGHLLGAVGLHGIDRRHRCAALDFWVRRSHQWRGIATQAAFLMARDAFANTSLQRIEMVVGEQHVACRRVAEKLAARFEGKALNRLCIAGRQQAAAIYSLTPQSGFHQP